MRDSVVALVKRGCFLVMIAALCGLAGCGNKEAEPTASKLPEAVAVEVKPVTRVAVNQVIEVSGTLEADKTAPLSFKVPGKVSRILVDEGDHVQAGTVLAKLQSSDYENNLAIAEAELVRAKDAYDRYVPLFKEGAIAEQSYVEVKTGLSQAVATRNNARVALGDTELVSPIPGIVGAKGVEVGQMVSPEVLAFTIVKTDVVYARVSVPESEIDQVVLDQDAEVSIPAMGGRTFKGQVSMVGAMADERSRTYSVKIVLSNPKFTLRPGMIVQACIHTQTPVDILTVPGRAIVRDADNLQYVFVADAKSKLAQRRRVITGSTFHNEIQVQNGLYSGESVVVAGQNKLTDGATIAVTNLTQE